MRRASKAEQALGRNLRRFWVDEAERFRMPNGDMLTVRQFAKQTGLSHQTIYDYMSLGNGAPPRHEPGIAKIEAVAAALGMEAWVLLSPALIPVERNSAK